MFDIEVRERERERERERYVGFDWSVYQTVQMHVILCVGFC